MRLVLAIAMAACIGCSSDAATTHSQPPPQPCAGVNDPVEVIRTFVQAVEADDTTAYERCEYPGAVVNEDLIRGMATNGLLLVDLTIETRYLPPPASNEVVYRIPAPDQPGEGRPPHQSGVHVTVALEPDGLYYVTGVRLYTST